MSAPSHRPSQRDTLLDVALDLVRAGGAPSLDAVAKAGGVSKPGLMYHFPTKKALVLALVDHVIDGFEQSMRALVGGGPETVDAEARIAAYLRWATTHEHDASDLVMMTDPRLRVPTTERWAERLAAWTGVPADLPAGDRGRLNAVRLLADGAWYAETTGIGSLPADDRRAVLAAGLELLDGARP